MINSCLINSVYVFIIRHDYITPKILLINSVWVLGIRRDWNETRNQDFRSSQVNEGVHLLLWCHYFELPRQRLRFYGDHYFYCLQVNNMSEMIILISMLFFVSFLVMMLFQYFNKYRIFK